MRAQTFDKEKIHLNIARLKKAGHNFEIDVDPDMAIAFKHSGEGDIRDIIKAQDIFSDVMKGQLASEHVLKDVFDTDDPIEVAKRIIKEGEIQLTASHRQMLRDKKRKAIMNLIHRNGVDPRTSAPIPLTRIENAFEQAKIKVDEIKSADQQVKDIVKKLMVVMPIKFETKELEISVGHKYASQVFSAVKQFGKVTQSDWTNDGGLLCTIEIPGGLEEECYDKLNTITHGEIETKVK